MHAITGTVERITFYNDENGYTVLRLRPEIKNGEKIIGASLDGLVTVVGNLPDLSPGENIHLEGEFRTHPRHGLQFFTEKCEKLLPVSASGIERYLGSGLIRGIGTQLAKRIVSRFKTNTLEIIENDPHQLMDVPGIGPDRTEKIVKAWEEQKQIKEIMLFLHSHNVTTNLAVKIYKKYGDGSLDVVTNNPYQLEQDIYGIGFKTADRIAQNLGLSQDHPSRIEAGIIYAINEMVNEGHVYSPAQELSERAVELLQVPNEMIKSGLDRLVDADRIRKDASSQEIPEDKKAKLAEPSSVYGEPILYLTPFYHSERGVASKLDALMRVHVTPKQGYLIHESVKFSPEQVKAVETAILNPVSIITGGPGTGKTTCLQALIRHLEANKLTYALVSPTGRAAKRLSEATMRPASTIHRLLAFKPGEGFKYNENHPLNIKFLVVDETSMLDLLLTYHLLRAVRPGTQVLFVGDVDQLPSVGAGDILRDLILCGKIPTTYLKTIYRQSADSQIVANSHRINHGKMPDFSNSLPGDFFLFPAESAADAANWVSDLVSARIPDQFGLNPVCDIQVLTPMYRGQAGVDSLNQILQEKLNPFRSNRIEQKLFGKIYRVGDKVMQIRNNYDKEVFNGDIGMIGQINRIEQNLTIFYDDVRSVCYEFAEADELVHAYAISVHKSQGSEFPAIVMPILMQHYIMLQRNLVYTGITRAKHLCILVGNEKALRIALGNTKVSQRYSNLSKRISEI